MREIRALLWKEWHETRPFLWIAWALFIGLPIIGGVEGLAMYSHRFEFAASPWIIPCAPLMAIVVGVACTCRDLKTKLEDFWQSRPMGSMRLFIIKYCVGLAVTLAACGLPLAIEYLSLRDNSISKVTLWLSFLWTAIFSTAFACGCIFRKTAHAAAVAILAVLLIFFLPVVFPPLHAFTVGRLLDFESPAAAGISSAIIEVAAGTLALSLVTLFIALLAVRFDWHIASEQPLIYATVSSAFLVLLCSAAYQLGTNLPILSQIELPRDEGVYNIVEGKGSLTAYLYRIAMRDRDGVEHRINCIRPLTIASDSLLLGSESASQPNHDGWSFRVATSKRDPSIHYGLDSMYGDGGWQFQLSVYRETSSNPASNARAISLWPDRNPNRWGQAGYLYQYRDHLYVVGRRSIVFDISEPLNPRQTMNEPIDWQPSVGDEALLPPAPGLPAAQRLDLLMDIVNRSGQGVFDGKLWCHLEREGNGVQLVTSRVKSLSNDRVEFQFVGRYRSTLAQSLLGSTWFRSLRMRNGLLYGVSYQQDVLSVFDVGQDGPPKLVAHFASPGVSCCEPLPDGRAIAGGGNSLWLLGPPPRR